MVCRSEIIRLGPSVVVLFFSRRVHVGQKTGTPCRLYSTVRTPHPLVGIVSLGLTLPFGPKGVKYAPILRETLQPTLFNRDVLIWGAVLL